MPLLVLATIAIGLTALFFRLAAILLGHRAALLGLRLALEPALSLLARPRLFGERSLCLSLRALGLHARPLVDHLRIARHARVENVLDVRAAVLERDRHRLAGLHELAALDELGLHVDV